jgi:hypothetical protein
VLAAALLPSALAAGCAVSETRRPTDHGDAVAIGAGGSSPTTPRTADEATGPEELVDFFFAAAVGGDDDAVQRVQDFLVPEARNRWDRGDVLTVVRVTSRSADAVGSKYRVTVGYREIGTMTAEGMVQEAGDHTGKVATFTVVRQDPSLTQWRLESAPDGLMISDSTLDTYYRPSPVYFWDLKRRWLVPDVRYLPLTMSGGQRPTQMVKWMLGGPSPWLRPAVFFRPGTNLKDDVVTRQDGSAVVNLTSAAATDDRAELQRLVDQLRWTLRAYVTGPVYLQIEDQDKRVDVSPDRYLRANLAAASRQPELFSVDAGSHKVVAQRGPSVGATLPILGARANAGVTAAALSVDKRLAAFVRGNGQVLTVVSAGPDEPNSRFAEHDVDGLSGSIGRPAWIPDSANQLLVPAGGELYAVNATGNSRDITPDDLVGGVRSVSVSPDGRRVAIATTAGRAYAAALEVDNQGFVSVGSELRGLAPGVAVSAVAWASETHVLVAGSQRGGRAALYRVTADGAIAVDTSPEEAALTDVVAFPDSTTGVSGLGDIVARTVSGVWVYVFRSPTRPEPAPELVAPFYAG